MRIKSLSFFFIAAFSVSCTHDGDQYALPDEEVDEEAYALRGRITDPGLLDIDIVQRTCALYVAIRSRALKDPIAFGREMDGSMVRWNMCDDKSMVACAKVPTADGDTVRTGIPWPYGVPQF